MKVERINASEDAAALCEEILRKLPNWFGIEEAVRSYVKDVQRMTTFAAVGKENTRLGFLTLHFHNPQSVEIHVMGVLPEHHRKGVGRALIAHAVRFARAEGAKFLTVKTLSASRPDPYYDRTRDFYLSAGFTPLEEFKTLWGETNPCLLMVKALECRD